MTLRNILVPAYRDYDCTTQLDAALQIAMKLQAHIRLMFIQPDPAAVMSSLPEVVIAAGVNQEAVTGEGCRIAQAARRRFEEWRAHHGIASGPVNDRLDSAFATWVERTGEIEPLVMRYGRLSDLIIVKRPASSSQAITAERIFDTAVFGAGRPTLVVPQQLPHDPLRHVIIAWNGSLEAAHAVSGAMTLLHEAENVSIFATSRSANGEAKEEELRDALKWHGIHAELLLACKASQTTGEALLDAVVSQDATLVVMGAYTHSRVRQAQLGGLTRYVLSHLPIPVLMTH